MKVSDLSDGKYMVHFQQKSFYCKYTVYCVLSVFSSVCLLVTMVLFSHKLQTFQSMTGYSGIDFAVMGITLGISLGSTTCTAFYYTKRRIDLKLFVQKIDQLNVDYSVSMMKGNMESFVTRRTVVLSFLVLLASILEPIACYIMCNMSFSKDETFYKFVETTSPFKRPLNCSFTG